MYNLNLAGTGVAIITPFLKNNGVDYAALSNLVKHVVKNGVNYIVVLGTTGESVVLSADEKHAVIKTIHTAMPKKVPLILGVGGNHTTEVVNQLKLVDATLIDGILSVTPYYNKPTQNGLYQHYKTIAAATSLPIIIYNVPGRTGVNMTASTQLALANDVKNIVATKEASGNVEQIMSIINQKPKNFSVISGDDVLTLPLMACGAIGVISVSANAYPAEVSKMVNLCLQGKFEAAQKLHYRLMPITQMMFAEGSPAGVKEILQHKNLCTNKVRLPLVNVSKQLSKNFTKYLDV
ncbi:MAG: 4-hydroxy-tetrahydrodipicolinate synthase [Bacteroidia bacterium]|nr:4-hydroxy-tetrahydrodipicolinate synthase [Bacteroidia bacterium]HQU99719.1 4-hydroxy-tetrahydrodipicolinate synthase [Bacteroidia bacterium]